VDELVAHGREVAPREPALDAAGELRVDRDQVLERPVLGAGLAHPDLVVLLVEGGLDLAQVAAHEVGHVALAAQDLAAGLDHAARAQGVGLAGIAERRAGALVGLEERPRRPRARGGLARRHAGVDGLERPPGQFADLLEGMSHGLHEGLLRWAAGAVARRCRRQRGPRVGTF
jgi:hypothetical protein